jgi:ketosteroid isomerase-like protein
MTILTDPDDRTLLLDHDRRFFDALVAADVARLDDLLADDFIMVAIDNGAVATRADLLGLMSSGTLRFPAVRSFPDEAVVRRVGDVGIVVGRTSMNFANSDGTVFTAGSRYTHVFASDSIAGWRLVSAQGTEIKPGS